MAQRLPSLNALRAFEAVARHLSVAKAADELHVTPAAVSQQLRVLEEDLGVEHFTRVKRALRPTEIAEAGYGDLRDGFDSLARGVAKMRARTGRSLLTLSVEPSFAATWLVARLERLRRRQPELDVLLETSMRLVNLEREGFDLAIRYGAGVYPGLESARLFAEEVFPVCSPRLLETPAPLRQPSDLRHHTLLHLEWVSAYVEWPDWAAWLAAAGATEIDARRGPRFTDHALALQAAVEGQGVALGSTALIADDLAAGRLVAPFDFCLTTRFGYFLVWPKDAAKRPEAAAFRAWLLDEAQASAAPATASNPISG